MKSCTTFAAGFLLLLTLLPSSSGSLLPILDRHGSSLSDRYADPSRILEHIPFGLDRDELAAVAHDRVDWKETPDAHLIMIDVPGLKKDDLKVEVDNGVLRVSGERKREEEKKGEHWHCVERAHGKFWRLFRLPNNVHLDSVQETLEDGVLTVRLPKLSPDKVKGPKVVSIAGREEEKGKLGAAETKKATLEDGVLTVRLPKLSPDKVKGPKVVSIARREEEKGKLGAAETKKATLEDGVLTVRLPKLSPDKVKGPKVVSITGREEEKGKLGAAETKKVDL